MSFSEKSSDTKISPKVTPTVLPQKAKASDDVLMVGQCVALINSELRGKIVSIGKKIKIELEDGLTIDAAYGEFTVTHEHELSALIL